jgi:calmodulin
MSKEEIQSMLDDDAKLTEVATGAFQAVDTDGSGQVDKNELKNAMTAIANDTGMDPPSDEMVQGALDALDTSGDGKVSLDEFKVLIKQVLEALVASM